MWWPVRFKSQLYIQQLFSRGQLLDLRRPVSPPANNADNKICFIKWWGKFNLVNTCDVPRGVWHKVNSTYTEGEKMAARREVLLQFSWTP